MRIQVLIQTKTIYHAKGWDLRMVRLSTIGPCIVVLLMMLASAAHATQQPNESPAPVRLFGQTVFIVRTGLADVTPEARAASIEKRLHRLVQSNPALLNNHDH